VIRSVQAEPNEEFFRQLERAVAHSIPKPIALVTCYPANPTACCNSKGTTCAKWAGAHLVSAGCIQWGVLEIEAAFNMPANAGGFYFTATYVVYGAADPAWNEIDIGMINNVLGDLEFHATVFTADKDLPTATMMDALNFAAQPIGTSAAVTAPVSTINNVKVPKVFYNSSFAAQFHTYKVVWTKNTVTWMVDTTVRSSLWISRRCSSVLTHALSIPLPAASTRRSRSERQAPLAAAACTARTRASLGSSIPPSRGR
jgi:hypothetical protein